MKIEVKNIEVKTSSGGSRYIQPPDNTKKIFMEDGEHFLIVYEDDDIREMIPYSEVRKVLLK